MPCANKGLPLLVARIAVFPEVFQMDPPSGSSYKEYVLPRASYRGLRFNQANGEIKSRLKIL